MRGKARQCINESCAKQGKMRLKRGQLRTRSRNGEARHVRRTLASSRRIGDAPSVPFCRPGSMPIDHATVRRIARLARLSVAEADIAQLAQDLGRVLGLADSLGNADLGSVEPM